MERKLDLKLIVVGIVVHVIVFYSIFDVYFKSPLVHGMRPIDRLSADKSPAKRLVLFVADGLRADTFFDLIDSDSSLFLSEKKNGDAAFAMSNTQVPTESRPGHVAMIAGFYEDLSAVAKGWKENPVDFDSVFNRSRHTWSWGSPDILNMFTRSSENVFIRTYDSSIEDFAAENASVLDTWVLHHFKKFMYHSEVNVTATKMLHEDQVVFFFHFLGIDTNGHSKKPHSKDYVSNVILVDGLVEEINQILNKYYSNDNETTFIFTSDHGMTDWGSHGSGDDSETLTPFVAWGKGIKYQKYDRNNLINFKQADIAPLMSHLIGVPIPVNSVGKIPISLLNSTDEQKCLTLKMNALQIIEQLKIKHHQCKNSAIFFKEFKDLTMMEVKEILMAVDTLIESKSYGMAIEKLNDLIDLSLQALDYYHKYNKFYLGTCILFSCVAWIIYLLMHNLLNVNHDDAVTNLKRQQLADKINWAFTAAIVISIVLSFYQQFQITYYVYTLLPLFLWRSICLNFKVLGYLAELWSTHSIRNTLYFVTLFLGIECLVFTFFYRWIFSVVLALYSLYLINEVKSSKQTALKWTVVASSLLLAVFPLLPVIKGHTHFYLVYLSMLAMNAIYIWLFNKLEILAKTRFNSILMLVLNAVTLLNVFWIRKSIENNAGLPKLGQMLSCLVVFSCVFVPVLSRPLLKRRLVYVLFSLANVYFHLSISYESLFILVLGLQMISWLALESFKSCGQFNIDLALAKARSSRIVDHDEDEFENLTWSNTFRVFLLVLHLLVAFFGTGNMASINSFDPVSVYCFLTVFNPFVMGFFLFLKIVIPFLIVIVVFYCIYDVINISLKTSFTFLMIISDIMALHFFFLIRTEGSWLDIGTSISHYAIVMIKIIFVSMLFSVANFLFTFELSLPGTRLLSSIKSRLVKSD